MEVRLAWSENLPQEFLERMAADEIPFAIEELKRRGVPIPVPYRIRQHADAPVPGVTTTTDAVERLDFPISHDTPRNLLPLGVLEGMAADGDETAVAELRYRYPGRYDERGKVVRK